MLLPGATDGSTTVLGTQDGQVKTKCPGKYADRKGTDDLRNGGYYIAENIVTRSSDDRRVLDWRLDLLGTFTAREYTSQVTIIHKLVLSVILFASGFLRRMFLCFQDHVLAGWRLSHAIIMLWPMASTASSRAGLTSKCQPPNSALNSRLSSNCRPCSRDSFTFLIPYWRYKFSVEE
jgi:hypothetical protein